MRRSRDRSLTISPGQTMISSAEELAEAEIAVLAQQRVETVLLRPLRQAQLRGLQRDATILRSPSTHISTVIVQSRLCVARRLHLPERMPRDRVPTSCCHRLSGIRRPPLAGIRSIRSS